MPTTNRRPLGPDAVWQAHADLAAKYGITSCQECNGEPVSASLTFEDGTTFVGEACYRKWDKDTENRNVNA